MPAKPINLSGFDQAATSPEPSSGGLKLDGFDSHVQSSAPGYLETIARGAGQGASAGFEDEGRARLMSALGQGDYKQLRDAIRAKNKAAEKENPLTYLASKIAGGVLPAAFTEGATLPLAMGKMAVMGGANAVGDSEREGVESLKDAPAGVVGGGIAGGLGYGAGKAIQSLAPKFAIKATGATGKELEDFSENAGPELLKQKMVDYGRVHPANILKKAEQISSENSQSLGQSLGEFDAQGVTAPKDDLYAYLKKGAHRLIDRGRLADARKANGLIDNFRTDVEEFVSKEPNMKLSTIEMLKRGQKDAYNNADRAVKPAEKNLYDSLMSYVEKKGTEANPELADKFIKEKQLHGLIEPIKDATERKANQLATRIMGGAMDIGTGSIGVAHGRSRGEPWPVSAARGVAYAGARHYFQPRLAGIAALLSRDLGGLAPGAARAVTPSLIDLYNKKDDDK